MNRKTAFQAFSFLLGTWLGVPCRDSSPLTKLHLVIVFHSICFVSIIGNASGMTSSEAPVTFHQPGLAGSRFISVMDCGDPPTIKVIEFVLLKTMFSLRAKIPKSLS